MSRTPLHVPTVVVDVEVKLVVETLVRVVTVGVVEVVELAVRVVAVAVLAVVTTQESQRTGQIMRRIGANPQIESVNWLQTAMGSNSPLHVFTVVRVVVLAVEVVDVALVAVAEVRLEIVVLVAAVTVDVIV